jgi:hypothetical protein
MKKLLIYLLPLLLPIAIVIIVNESCRQKNVKEPFSPSGVVAMNSVKAFKNTCSWKCHNDTRYCINNHAKSFAANSSFVRTFYFGIIRILKSTGDYGLANIIFLVLLWPLLMYLLLVKALNIQIKINKLKANNR